MPANTSLLTDTARLAATKNAENYSAGVAAHINGDFGQHVQLEIVSGGTEWFDGTNMIPTSLRLRFLAVVDGQQMAFVAPIVPFTVVGAGNGPEISAQPVSVSKKPGETATFSIQAKDAGGTPLVYRWRHNDIDIPSAVSSTLVVTNVRGTDGGQYDCVVSNPFGSIISNTANLTVLIPIKRVSPSSDGGGISLPFELNIFGF